MSELRPLLGIPVLTSGIKKEDMVLFGYNGMFAHIIPNGKEVFKKIAQLAKDKEIKVLNIPINSNIKNEKEILRFIPDACENLNIKIPKITITYDKEALNTEWADELIQIAKEALPRSELYEDTVWSVITEGPTYSDLLDNLLSIPGALEKISHDAKYLELAIANGNVNLVRTLSAIPQVREQAKKEFLEWAIAQNQIEIVRELLKIPKIRAEVAKDKKILNTVIKNEQAEILHELLTIPEMQEYAASDNNQALTLAKEEYEKNKSRGNPLEAMLKIMHELLKVPEVRTQSAKDNETLIWAIHEYELDLVRDLLTIPGMPEQAASDNNRALRLGLQLDNPELINVLLTYKAVKNALSLEQIFDLLCHPSVNDFEFEKIAKKKLFKSSLSKQTLLEWVNKLRPHHRQAQVLIQQYLQYYGYSLPSSKGMIHRIFKYLPRIIQRALNYFLYLLGYTPEQALIDTLRNSIKRSFSDYFKDPCNHAGKLLQVSANVAEMQKRNRQYFTGNSESAMEESLVSEAVTRFKTIEPAFQKQFEAMENNVEEIEKKIYGFLLDRKIAQLEKEKSNIPNAQEVIDFIHKHKEALIQREEKALAVSRKYFVSNTDTLDIALRALDPGALSHDWPKLFVAPDANKENTQVFSTRAASEVALSLKQTTDITRKILCYTYVVAQDPSLKENERENILEAFIHYLAEISRAHNDDASDDSDNPSCYPGTLTRLDLIFQKHPNFYVEKELFRTTNEIGRQLVLKAFNAELSSYHDEAKKLELYNAISLFSSGNAIDILHQPNSILTPEGGSPDLKHLLSVRKVFFEKYFGKQGRKGIDEINKQLAPHKLSVDNKQEIALLPLINMGNGRTIYSLTEAFKRSSRPAEMPLQKDIITNPYNPHYKRILGLLEKAPLSTTQKENIKNIASSQYIEAAIKKAYFEYTYSKNANLNMHKLEKKIEKDYRTAWDRVSEKQENMDNKKKEWPFYESIITELMTTSGSERDKFPTEQSINDNIKSSDENVIPTRKLANH